MPGEEKTEKATPRKRKKAREEGDVLQSKEIISAIFLLSIFVALRVLGPFMYQNLLWLMGGGVENLTRYDTVGAEALLQLMREGIWRILLIIGPILAIIVAINIIASGVQTRFIFAFKALKPKFSKLNPITGMKKLFALRALVEMLKGLIKISIIAYVVYSHIMNILPRLPDLLDIGVTTGILFLADSIFWLGVKIGGLYIFLAALDFLYQRYEHEKKLKMSKQEVKEEYKNLEGDPQIKSKIRQKQQEMAQRRMMAAVPEADVVIRNPTHYAVALKYDPDKDGAPVVVAKGADYIALRIIAIAEEHEIAIRENRPLARALYEAVELERQIPAEFYHAVAEVLAAIYELKNKKL